LPQLFQGGIYVPLRVTGRHADRVCAFARRSEHHVAIVVAPRLFVGLCGDDRLPLGAEVWQDTQIEVPADLTGIRLADVFTGAACPFAMAAGKPLIALAAALATFPAALFCDAAAFAEPVESR
jgi:(1->4)-alpha-D-glucan 1-alpha-D-glucosylmutase